MYIKRALENTSKPVLKVKALVKIGQSWTGNLLKEHQILVKAFALV